MKTYSPLISILVNTNNEKNIIEFLDSYENNAYDSKNFEVIVNIDKDNHKMSELLNDQKKHRSFDLKIIETTGGYFSGHIHNNMMLDKSNPSSYFLTCVGDRMCINTKDWDKIILEYKYKYEDNIYRVKCSSYKYRNYKHYWECCFAPANIVFTTRKWLEICGSWSPCFSHDAFQQCVSFYMFTFDNFNADQVNRDIIDEKLHFEGQIPEPKSDKDQYDRISGQLKKWKILTSYKMQKEAKKIGMLLLANIFIEKYDYYENKIVFCRNSIKLVNKKIKNGKKLKDLRLDYKINYLSHTLNNFFKSFFYLNFSGSGFYNNSFNFGFNIIWFLNHRYYFLKGLKDKYNNFFSNGSNK